MSDNESDASRPEPSPNGDDEGVPWSVNSINQQAEQRWSREKRDPIEKASNSTAWATWVLAFTTVVLGGIGILQYTVINGQLAEMKSGGADTRTLAQATKTQSDILKIDERPWVSSPTIESDTCLDKTAPNPKIGNLNFVLKFRNSGKTPAYNLYTAADFANEDNKYTKAEEFCAEGRNNHMRPGVTDNTIIPSEYYSGHRFVHREFRGVAPDAIPEQSQNPYIAGCSVYFSEIDQKSYESIFFAPLVIHQGPDGNAVCVDGSYSITPNRSHRASAH